MCWWVVRSRSRIWQHYYLALIRKCASRKQDLLYRILILKAYILHVTAAVIEFIMVHSCYQFLDKLSSLISCVISAPDICAVTKKCKLNSSGRNCTLTKPMSRAISQNHPTAYKMAEAQTWNWHFITSFSSFLHLLNYLSFWVCLASCS